MALAVREARLGRREALRRLLGWTAALGVAFLVVKGIEYSKEWQEGVLRSPATALFFYLYFVATGVHALHLAIGIAIVLWLTWRLRLPSLPQWRIEEIDAVGLYWHFVDAVWVFLYPLFYLVDLR